MHKLVLHWEKYIEDKATMSKNKYVNL